MWAADIGVEFAEAVFDLQVLNNLAEKYSERPFSYLWAQGGVQPGLEAALGVGGCALKP